MRLTLRTRVVLAAAGAIVVAVVVLAIAISVLAGRQLRSSLDNSLRDRAAEVARLSASAPAVLTTPGALDASIGGQQLSIEVLDRRGRMVARSLSLGGSLLPTRVLERVIESGRPRYANDSLGGQALRLYAAPLPTIGGPAAGGAVVVAGTTADIDETLDRLHLFALLSALAAAGLASAAAFLLVRRALRPVERLSAGAAEVERTGDVTRRLPEPRTGDEVGRLALTLNRMLTALEHARDAERRFPADASHELRTPVTALRGNVDYLQRHGYDEAVLEEVAADTARLSALVRDLLVLSREDAGGTADEYVRLEALVEEVAQDDPQIAVDAPQPVAVRGDRPALERALRNLVDNARRYGPPGGRITISARQDNGSALLSVRDEGRGLSEEEAEQAFERFWRGRHDAPGSGLGLAIVRATAERHGGRVGVCGPEFTIELPALREFSNGSGTPRTERRKGHQ
jgi:two-component system sensor histidine kinase MprB